MSRQSTPIKNRIKEHRLVKASELLKHPLNYRTHPERQKKLLSQSLSEIGHAKSLTAYETPQGLRLIDGHLRADMDPEAMVPVEILDVTDAEARQLLLTLDPLAALAETDSKILDDLLKSTPTTGDLDAWLKERAEDAGILPPTDPGEEPAEIEPDRYAEVLERWPVQPGEIWQLGRHRLLCGDSTQAPRVDDLLGDASADLVLTDPPYGVSYVGKTSDALTLENDDLGEGELASLMSVVFSLCERKSRPGAYWYATVPAGPLHLVFASDWRSRGILRQIMVWVKDRFVLGHSEYHYQHEPILFGWTKGDRRKNSDRTRSTVWTCDRPTASRDHPTMKPVELWERAIADSTDSDDLVFDPFCGSGTTVLACERLGRQARVIEMTREYCAVICERWHKQTGQTPKRVSSVASDTPPHQGGEGGSIPTETLNDVTINANQNPR